MAKVIVERPRHGSRTKRTKGYSKAWRKISPDEWPKRESIYAHKGRTKWFNEHLGPLRRYLWKQLGRPWDKVFAEICANLRVDSAVQSHVRDHLADFVVVNAVYIDGVPCVGDGIRRGRRIDRHLWPRLYVCPRTGLLRTAEKKRSRPQLTRIVDGEAMQYHFRAGRWYEVRLCAVPPDVERCYDALLETPVARLRLEQLTALYGRAVFALSKRPLSAAEARAVRKRSARFKRTALSPPRSAHRA